RPDYPALLGACAYAEGQPAQAVPYLERAVGGNWRGDEEGRHRALATLAAARLALGQAEAAAGLAALVAREEPRWPTAWFLLAQAREASGDPASARDAYRQTLALDPGHAPARQALQRLTAAP